MSYLNMPPGRNRAIAYYNNLLNRRRNLHSFNTIRQPLSYIPSRFRDHGIELSPIVRRDIQEYINEIPATISSFILRNNNLSYNVLSNLENVKIGLSLSTLIKNSEIKIEKSNTKDDIVCVICQENIENYDIIRKMNCCSKEFHVDCIDKWFSENKKCPLCNFIFT